MKFFWFPILLVKKGQKPWISESFFMIFRKGKCKTHKDPNRLFWIFIFSGPHIICSGNSIFLAVAEPWQVDLHTNNDSILFIVIYCFSALLELREPVYFTENIRPICLPVGQTTATYHSIIGTISGWGKTGDNNWAENLKEVDVLIFKTDFCKKIMNIQGAHTWDSGMGYNTITEWEMNSVGCGILLRNLALALVHWLKHTFHESWSC